MGPLSRDGKSGVHGVGAYAFAREGAEVATAGRTLAKLGGVAGEVGAAGLSRAEHRSGGPGFQR